MEEYNNHIEECRRFILSIFDRALIDALSINDYYHNKSAINFINSKNKAFKYYSHLLDLEPEYACKKMKEKIIILTLLKIYKIYINLTYFWIK